MEEDEWNHHWNYHCPECGKRSNLQWRDINVAVWCGCGWVGKEEDLITNTPCPRCGSTETPLHTSGICANCATPAERNP